MDWNTNVISTKISGTLQPVTAAMPPGNDILTWAFATGECGSESWGGVPGSGIASANVQAFVAAGKKYIISTGGAAGRFTCGSDEGFATFVNNFMSENLVGVDFDIEGGQQEDITNLVRRAKAAQASFPQLRLSFTLATLGGAADSDQLNQVGRWTMQAIADEQLSWSNLYVNLMVRWWGCVGVRGHVTRGVACWC